LIPFFDNNKKKTHCSEESALKLLMEKKKSLRENRLREEQELKESLSILKETLTGKNTGKKVQL
jgi:hypothetical protein